MTVGAPEEATRIIDYFQVMISVPTWRSTGGALENDRHVLGAADIMVGSRREREEA